MRRFLKADALAMFAAASLQSLASLDATEALAQQHQSFLRIGETGNGRRVKLRSA